MCCFCSGDPVDDDPRKGLSARDWETGVQADECRCRGGLLPILTGVSPGWRQPCEPLNAAPLDATRASYSHFNWNIVHIVFCSELIHNMSFELLLPSHFQTRADPDSASPPTQACAALAATTPWVRGVFNAGAIVNCETCGGEEMRGFFGVTALFRSYACLQAVCARAAARAASPACFAATPFRVRHSWPGWDVMNYG